MAVPNVEHIEFVTGIAIEDNYNASTNYYHMFNGSVRYSRS